MVRYSSNRSSIASIHSMVAIALLFAFSHQYCWTHAWMPSTSINVASHKFHFYSLRPFERTSFFLNQSTNVDMDSSKETTPKVDEEEIPYDYDVPEDAIIHIKPKAMRRLRELRDQRRKEGDEEEFLTLRMGVRSGGCSGMSYVMDFCSADSVNAEDDQVDTYEKDRIQCVVDSKSMLYLYGLQLDYSTELIGGGFKFYNPNAEESCGCGSSFGV